MSTAIDLNAREVASVFWVTVLAILLLAKPSVRSAAADLARAMVQPALVRHYVGFSMYVGGLLMVLSRYGLWSPSHAKVTGLWWLAAMFIGSQHAVAEDTVTDLTFQMVRRALAASVVVEAYVGLVTFPLMVELFLVPVVVLLTAVNAYATTQTRHRPVERFVTSLLAVVGLGVLGYVTWSVLQSSVLEYLSEAGAQVGYPMLFTLVTIPYFVALLLYAHYQTLNGYLSIRLDSKEDAWLVTRTLIQVFHFDVRSASQFAKRCPVESFRPRRALIDQAIAASNARTMSGIAPNG